MKLQKHWKISLLAILAIGPGFILNGALTSIQSLIQKNFGLETSSLFSPLIIGSIAFALFIPLGPLLKHKLGVRLTYQISMTLFILGALLAASATDMQWLSVGRFVQGIATGVMLMIMIPMLVLSFPIDKRNLAFTILLGGFFGSVIMGMFLGNVAIMIKQWRWLFYIAGVISLTGMMLCRLFLQDEHPHHPESHHRSMDILGITVMIIISVSTLAAFNHLQEWVGSPFNVWFTIGGIFLTLIVLFIVEFKAKNPLVDFHLIMHPKPLLGMLITITSNTVMAGTLLALQGLLQNVYGIPTKQLLLLYMCQFIGVIAAALLCTLLYDKLGPGLLGMIGSLAIATVSLQWFYLKEPYSFMLMALDLTLLTAGIGITTGSGLMGAALGGALPDLVKRMTVVQFIRYSLYIALTVFIGWVLKEDSASNLKMIVLTKTIQNEQEKQSIALSMTYHDFFLASFILSLLLLCLCLGKHLTGKGHKLAHKPHHEQKNKKFNSSIQ